MASETIRTVFAFLFGLALGSFLNVCIHRIPLKKSIVTPPSSCPQCGERIRFYDNIPLISYLWLLGRCRSCRRPIPVHYPLVELIMGLLSAALFMRYDLGVSYFLFLAFSAALVAISFIDLHHKIIPEVISLPGIVLGLALSMVSAHISWVDSLLGIVGGGGSLYLVAVIYERMMGHQGMGVGDVKLLAMIGAWLGWRSLPCIILVSSISGIVMGGASLLLAHRGLRTQIPFGPFLSLGALIWLFFGPELVSWYLGLLNL